VDAGVHHLQGEAEGVTPSDLAPLLAECYTDRLSLLQRHVASAVHVGDYDINNAYQYIVAREETHVYWLHRAVLDAGAIVPAAPALPTIAKAAIASLAAADASANATFVDKWAPRVRGVSHARHRKMLEVIVGEVQEHRRLFEQAAEGRTDVIGRSMPDADHRGLVLGTRWVE
jgi:hypothetical protein